MEAYYEQDGITIYHGDCRDVLPTFQSKTFSIVVADPPYEKEAHTQMRRTRAQIEGRKASAAMTFAPITDELRSYLVRESLRLSAGWVLMFCQAEAVGSYSNAFAEAW